MGWDWHLGILEVAEKLAKYETDVDLLISCLNKTDSDYQRERAQMSILRLLHQYKTQKEVSQFIEANLLKRTFFFQNWCDFFFNF